MLATAWVKSIGAVSGRATEGVTLTTPILMTPPFCGSGFSNPPQKTRCFIGRQRRWLAICAGLIWLGSGQAAQPADNRQAREIVGRVTRLFTGQSTIATVEMEITKPGLHRKILMQFWSVGQSKVLVRIRQPREDAGTAILKVGNKAWMYLPKANRTIAMSGSMMMTPWMGSDFTLDDLTSQTRLTNDYTIMTSFVGYRGGVAISDYTLSPKPAAAVVWGKVVLEIRRADLMPVWQRYYDESGKLVRELLFSDYAHVGGRLIPTHLVMRPLDHPGQQTTVTYDNIVFDAPISDTTFSLKNLKP